MATEYTKKDILLGQTIDTIVKNADENFDTLFDHADTVDDTLDALTKPDGTNSLISDNKINTSYLPDSILGQVEYQGTFNASSNSSSVVGTLQKGWYYICSTSGDHNPDATKAGTNYDIGDWAVYNGSSWDKIDNTDAVTLVNGQKGSVKTFKGTYSSGTTYYQGDQVIYDDCLWLYINESPAQTGPSDLNTSYWKIYGRVYSNATIASAGLMSKEDKQKLNKIDDSLLNVTKDDIGKVQDVYYNGESIINTSGIAVIPTVVIEDLQSEYTTVTASESKSLNGVTYYGFTVPKTDAAFEVYNSINQQIVTQKVLDGANLFIAVGTTAGQSVQIRKLSGGVTNSGSARLYNHYIRYSHSAPTTIMDFSIVSSSVDRIDSLVDLLNVLKNDSSKIYTFAHGTHGSDFIIGLHISKESATMVYFDSDISYWSDEDLYEDGTFVDVVTEV